MSTAAGLFDRPKETMPEKVKEVKKLEMKEEEEKEDKDLGSYFDTRSRVVETDFTSDM